MSETRMTVEKVERYLRSIHRNSTPALREALCDGFVVYERQTEQLLELIKRKDADSVLELMKATLIDSWGRAAQKWHDEQQKEALRTAGGSIHERGLRNVSGGN